MVFLKGIILPLMVFVTVSMLLAPAQSQKFAYKKPIYGKTNYIKEKRYKTKVDTPTTPSMTTTTTTTTTTLPPTSVITTTSANAIFDSNTEATSGEQQEANIFDSSVASPPATSNEDEQATTAVLDLPYITTTTASIASAEEIATTDTAVATTMTTPTVAAAAPAQNSNQPVPCTCGVFLTSQMHNGAPPEKPLIYNELDRIYPCNAVGRKQCQTKCLEVIVQHLPNSANIVCATLGKDCHKERAYLFIKNCQNNWWNTNLQAGREYCCKDGTPYRCPLVG